MKVEIKIQRKVDKENTEPVENLDGAVRDLRSEIYRENCTNQTALCDIGERRTKRKFSRKGISSLTKRALASIFNREVRSKDYGLTRGNHRENKK